MRLKPCKILPKNATDIKQMAKVRHLPFPLQNHPETVEFTFLTLIDLAHIAKSLKEEMENLLRQQGFLLGSSFPKPRCGEHLCSQNRRFLKEGAQPASQGANFSVPASPFVREEKNDKKMGREVTAKHEQTLAFLTDEGRHTQHFQETLVQCIFGK